MMPESRIVFRIEIIDAILLSAAVVPHSANIYGMLIRALFQSSMMVMTNSGTNESSKTSKGILIM